MNQLNEKQHESTPRKLIIKKAMKPSHVDPEWDELKEHEINSIGKYYNGKEDY